MFVIMEYWRRGMIKYIVTSSYTFSDIKWNLCFMCIVMCDTGYGYMDRSVHIEYVLTLHIYFVCIQLK